MAAKCEKFMSYSKNLIDICKNNYDWQKWNTWRIIGAKGTDMAYKCKMFEAVSLTLHGQ